MGDGLERGRHPLLLCKSKRFLAGHDLPIPVSVYIVIPKI